MKNLTRIKTEALKKRLSHLQYNLELYPENIATYKGKTNDDLNGADRFILNVAIQEKEIKNYDIKELVAKWESDLKEIRQMYVEYKAELERRKKNEQKN